MNIILNTIKENLKDIVENTLVWNNHLEEEKDQYTQYRYPIAFVDFSQQNDWEYLSHGVRECDQFQFIIHLQQENYIEIEDIDEYELFRSVVNALEKSYNENEFYSVNNFRLEFSQKNLDDTNITTHQIYMTCNIRDYSNCRYNKYSGLTFSFNIGIN